MEYKKIQELKKFDKNRWQNEIWTNGETAKIIDKKGETSLVDHSALPKIRDNYFSSTPLTKQNKTKYFRRSGSGGTLHKIIFGCPDGKEIDHINRDGLDNRASNIRFVSRAQNMQNRGPFRGKKYKGVCTREYTTKTVYRARIRVNGTLLNLGEFGCREEAARAYDKAAIEHYGDGCYLNFKES